MSWTQKLYEAYNAAAASEDDEGLVPNGFIAKKIKYNIILSADGRFRTVSEISEDEPSCNVPSTPQAASRTGDSAVTFPLADGLKYLLPRVRPENPKFEYYLEHLRAWCAAEHAPDCLRVVLGYLEKRTLTEDLESAQGLKLRLHSDEAVRDFKGKDIGGIACFSVESADEEMRLWKRKDVRESWSRYFAESDSGDTELCYITGKYLASMRDYPKLSGNAKLISSKDVGYPFQYKGRFIEDKSSVSVSADATEKIHSALRWLLNRQGFSRYGMSIVAWNIAEPAALSNTLWSSDGASFKRHDTFEPYAIALRNAAVGHTNAISEFCDTQDLTEEAKKRINEIVIIGLQAATNGRMSITYYQEIPGNVYVQRLDAWRRDCSWDMPGKERRVMSPSWLDICSAVIGTKQVQIALGDAKNSKSATKLMLETHMRLLNCVVNGSALPRDFVRRAFDRAVQPLSFVNDKGDWQDFEWKKCVATTCALIRKTRIDERGEPPSHILDRTLHDRDYLFGRLLADAHKLELDAADANSDKRTSALRAMARFVRQPCDTWQKLYLHLIPYMEKLPKTCDNRPAAALMYQRLFGEIERGFCAEDRLLPRPLSYMFLVGFSAQLRELYLSADARQPVPLPAPYAPPQDRDTLYGCLVAIADVCELETSGDSRGIGTNALLLMAKCAASPPGGWAHLHDKLLPSFYALNIERVAFYQRLIRKTEESFSVEERMNAAPLGSGFVHGYLSMRSALLTSDGLNMAAWQPAGQGNGTPQTRDAAFGALLALEDQAERRVLDRFDVSDKKRLSNAMRYLPRAARCPCETLSYLDTRMQPYVKKLSFPHAVTRQVDEIKVLIAKSGWDTAAPLGAGYLHAFYTYTTYTNFKNTKENDHECT